ncbi:unnamed protein product, partial [Rhizoctonia solani]
MSDDEYFGDDDLFTSEELDNIPALNQPPSPVLVASNLPNPPVQLPPVVSSDTPGSSANNPIVVGPTNATKNKCETFDDYECFKGWTHAAPSPRQSFRHANRVVTASKSEEPLGQLAIEYIPVERRRAFSSAVTNLPHSRVETPKTIIALPGRFDRDGDPDRHLDYSRRGINLRN